MNLNKVLESGGVDRYHSNPHIPNQTLSDHQWRVTVLLQHFYPQMNKSTILYALTHDAAELITGDTPSPAKQMQPALKVLLDDMEEQITMDWGIHFKLNQQEKDAVKVCDVIEGLLYCGNQILAGNRAAKETFQNWVDYCDRTQLRYNSSADSFVSEFTQEVKHVW